MSEYEREISDLKFSFPCPHCGLMIFTSISEMKNKILICPRCHTTFSLGRDLIIGTHVEIYKISLPELLKAVSRKKLRKRMKFKNE